MSKIFPIQTETACLLKWGWSSLFVWSGEAKSCHRVKTNSFAPSEIERFHNLPNQKAARTAMLEGKWPGNGCEYCRDIEAAGGMSDRQRELEMFEVDNTYSKFIPKELFEDNRAIEVNPTMLEIYLSNKCNMSCIYCAGKLSSLIVAENKIHGPSRYMNNMSAERAAAFDAEYPERLKYFWEWFEKSYSSLRYINILGGEPFYQAEAEQLIDFLLTKELKDLSIRLVSNLKVSPTKLTKLANKLSKLKKQNEDVVIGIVCSLDSFGEEQEYVRAGLDLDQWKRNFEYLIFNYPELSITVNSTVNVLSIKTMPDFLKQLNVWRAELKSRGFSGNIPHGFNMLTTPHVMKAGIMPKGFFDKEFKEILDNMPEDNGYQITQKTHMKGILKTAEETPYDPSIVEELKSYLDDMDVRKRKDWKKTFPWLDQFKP